MRVQHLLMAGALMTFMAACNNDAMEEVSSQSVEQVGNEIVGAKLLSSGATLDVTMEGVVESRLNGSGFENGDELGLGWFNIQKNITDAQGDKFPAVAPTDNKLYANHVFKKDNVWSSFANIYEGAHFAYYPHVHMSKVAEKEITLKNVQNSADAFEHLKEGFQTSPKFIMSEKDVQGRDLVLPVNLYDMTNKLKINIDNAGSPFATNTVLSKESIKYVAVTVNRKDDKSTFVTKVSLNPHNLPETKYKDGKLDVNANKAAMRNAKDLFLGGTKAAFTAMEAANFVKTVTAHAPKFAANSTVYINLFPSEALTATDFADKTPVRIDIETRFGHFTFANVKDNAGVQKVYEFLQGKVSKKGINTLTNTFGVDLKLADASWFSPSYVIRNVQEWDDAVAFANALKAEFPKNKNFEEAKFTLVGDVKFNNRKIFNIENGVKISVVSPEDKGKIVIDGTVDMVGNLTFPNDGTGNWVNIVVNKDAVFNVVSNVDTSIENNGTIKVAKGYKVGTVTNKNRIEVEYGAFVRCDGTTFGTIAYELNAETKPYMIANLIGVDQDNSQNEGQKRFAQVNTLVVTPAKALDLSEKNDAVMNDPYFDPTTVTEMPDLSKINVELAGGKIVYGETKEGSVKSVKNVTVKAAGSAMTDVKVLGTLTVEKGGEVTVDATKYQTKKNVWVKETQNIKNAVLKTNGTAIFNVDALVENLDTESKSMLEIKPEYKVTYMTTNGLNGIKDGLLVQSTPVVEAL